MNTILQLKSALVNLIQYYKNCQDGGFLFDNTKLVYLQLPSTFTFDHMSSHTFGFVFYSSQYLFFLGSWPTHSIEDYLQYGIDLSEEFFFSTLSTLYIEEIRVLTCSGVITRSLLLFQFDIQAKALNFKVSYYFNPKGFNRCVNTPSFYLESSLFSLDKLKQLKELEITRKRAFIEYVCLDSPFLYAKTSNLFLGLSFDTEYGKYNSFNYPKDSPLQLKDSVVLKYVLQGFDFLYCTGQVSLKNLHRAIRDKADYIYHIMTNVFNQIVGLEVCMLHWSRVDDCLYFWFGVLKDFDFERARLFLGSLNIVLQGQLGSYNVVSSFMAAKMEYTQSVTQMNHYFFGVYNRENACLHAKIDMEGVYYEELVWHFDFFRSEEGLQVSSKESETSFLQLYKDPEFAKEVQAQPWSVWAFVLYKNKVLDELFLEREKDNSIDRVLIWMITPSHLFSFQDYEL